MSSTEPGKAENADLLVIGGGINGAGIARDAAGRGLDVVLCEQGDLAEHTSSASTKLIHGGLRYLEHFDFLLVRHALEEREVLLRSAPHIIWPLRFILPYHRALRPRWLIRLGLLLYDSLGGRKLLPRSRSVDLSRHVAGGALKPIFTRAFEYSDCWVQDARLVVLNARAARELGARIMTRCKCVGLKRSDDHWDATLVDQRDGTFRQVSARAVVNATGPWVERTLRLSQKSESEHGVRLVKGSHIVVRKLFDHAYPYIFQNPDGRILFAIPFEQDYTLLGTTDIEIEIEGIPGKVDIDAEEVEYICTAINQYMRQSVSPGDVVWSYSGVRPLFDDASKQASKVTRDYVLQLDDEQAPIISIFGGKITTYRKLAEQVVDMLSKPLGCKAPRWTEGATLPGGDIADADFDRFRESCIQRYPWLEPAVLHHYARDYGTEIHTMIQGCSGMSDLGEQFGEGLYEREVQHLVANEWAESTEDILWRRTKAGLRLGPEARVRLQRWLDERRSRVPACT